MMFRLIIVVLSVIIPVGVFAGTNTDSLENLLSTRVHDTTRIIILQELAEEYRKKDLNKADGRIHLALNLAEKIKNPKLIAQAKVTKGLIIDGLGETENAIEITLEAENIYKEINNERGLGACYNNLGIFYRKLGIFSRALEYQLKSLEIREKLGDKQGMASALNNIGINCVDQRKYEEGIQYYKQSLIITREIDMLFGIALLCNNIGYAFQQINQLDSARVYLLQSIEAFEKIGHKIGVGNAARNLGINFMMKKNFTDALKYLEQSLAARIEAGDISGLAQSYTSLFRLYFEMNNLPVAIRYMDSASLYVKKSNNKELRLEYFQYSHPVYYRSGNITKAYDDLLFYNVIKDSLYDRESSENISRMRILMETGKKEKQILSLEADKKQKALELENERAVAEDERKKKIIFAGGLIAAITFLVLAVYAFIQKRKDNRIIHLQKQMVEEKNREILDSITYAKRIQSAILPPQKIVKEYLPESFILYKPKDIVAGDFYWLEHKNDYILFAACDCTGHGVPGAMVSVICNNGLNRAVREYGITNPGKILDKAREIVLEEFEKSEEEVKDGMDISLVSLAFRSKNESEERNSSLSHPALALKWAGANNPLWLIRSNEIIEIKADKQPIGKYADPKPFTTHEIEVRKGDTIYIFTDGFQDQFGGEKGKKLKARAFKELLLSVQDKNMTEQREIIDSEFEKWKGNLEQNDDVCIIGVKI